MWFVYSASENEPCLANAILVKLDDYIRRVSHSEFFNNIDIEKIKTLFQMLEISIRNGDDSILPASKLLELELSKVEQNLHIIDNSLKAMKVFFRIWLSGRPEKELFSEDLLTLITGFYWKIFDTQFLPLCEEELSSHPIMQFRGIFASICHDLIRISNYFSEFISIAHLNETSVTKLEFLTIRIIFQEVSTKQKDMIVTATNMSSLRASTMVLISAIYGNFPEQQGFILDEILSNFTKLNGPKNSRVYQLPNGSTIQLITALITRLIQTTGPIDKELFQVPLEILSQEEILDKKLQVTDLCSKRITKASKSAAEIVQYLISRAMKTTKSGDSPFRLLIDYFTEDLSKLLYNPDWPAAELLFSTMASLLMKILDDDKEGVLASTMALELLATIGSKIFKFHKDQDNKLELALNMSVISFHEYTDVASKILYYLQSTIPKDSRSFSSYQYSISLYTSILSSIWQGTKNEGDDKDKKEESELHQAVSSSLSKVLSNGKEGFWPNSENTGSSKPTREAIEVVYHRFLTSRNIAQLYDRILNTILRSLDHNKINIRTKALRDISILLEQNAEIFLLPQVQKSLNQRIYDPSPQVRDATVDIIGKYIILKPETAKSFYTILCDRSNDTGLAVRKRVIKLLHELYIIIDEDYIKVEIAERIIRRVEDEETAISDLAISFLTEFFFPPFGEKKFGDIVDKQQQRKLAKGVISILIMIWSKSERNSRFLSDFFWKLFHPVKGVATPAVIQSAKSISSILAEEASVCDDSKQCETLLGILSDLVGSNGSFMTQDLLSFISLFLVDETPSAQTSCFYTLSIFQKSLDKVGPLNPKFLLDTQNILMKRLGKFNVNELCVGIPCLWLVSKMMKDEKKLCIVAKSCFKAIQNSTQLVRNKKDVSKDPRVPRLLYILGNIGRYCEIDKYIEDFKEYQAKKPTTTVTELLIKTVMTFTDSTQGLGIRKVAAKNCCTICISHPLFFLSNPFLKFLDKIFKDEPSDLKITVMKSMIELLNHEEFTANSTAAMANAKKPDNVDLELFLGTTTKFHNEAVSASLMQRYLKNITGLALLSESELAQTATFLLERIVNQGLANPRLVISTIIALETSHSKEIRTIAKNMHAKLHNKHESMIEGSYVDGVRVAAAYRIRVSENIKSEYKSFSTFYPFLKSSRSGIRKFLSGVCRSLDFNTSEDVEKLKTHYNYTIFVCNSFSTLVFYTTEEVMILIYALDKIIAGVGVGVSHSANDIVEKLEEAGIDSSNLNSTTIDISQEPDVIEIPDVTVIEDNSLPPVPLPTAVNIISASQRIEDIVNASEVVKVAYSSVIVHMIWSLRSFIKRAYNISEEKLRDFNSAKLGKDTKPVSRSTGQIYEKLDLDAEVDIHNSFTDTLSNVLRLKSYLDQVSPDAQNPEDYFEGNDDNENFVAGAGLLSTQKKRSINDIGRGHPKKSKSGSY